MKVLVACEFSGIVRDAFAARGHDAWSCDIIPTERPGQHIVNDVRNVLDDGWDLMIAHPPCTYLTNSANRWLKQPGRIELRLQAVEFIKALFAVNIPMIAIENPIGGLSTLWRKPDQIVQPWQFGHGEVKATCFWLKGLPCLKPTDIVEGRKPRSYYESPSPDRWKNRSRTYQGIADAMASQWG